MVEKGTRQGTLLLLSQEAEALHSHGLSRMRLGNGGADWGHLTPSVCPSRYLLRSSEGLPSWLRQGKKYPRDAGDLGSIPAWGRSPGDGNGNLLQYPCLESPMHRGAWWATAHGVAKSRTRLSDSPFSVFPLVFITNLLGCVSMS